MPFRILPYSRFPLQWSFLKLFLPYFLGFWLLPALLLLSNGPVYAEWVLIEATVDERFNVYADPDSIRPKGNRVNLWLLYDYKTIQIMGSLSFMSSKQQREFDCVEELTREIAFTSFSGNMGLGKVTYSSSNAEKWEPVQPDGIGYTLWTFACRNKGLK